MRLTERTSATAALQRRRRHRKRTGPRGDQSLQRRRRPPLRCRHRFLSTDHDHDSLPPSFVAPSVSSLPHSGNGDGDPSLLASLSLGLACRPPLPSLGWTDSRRTDGGKSGQMDAKYANRERGRERQTESRFLKVKCSCSLWSFCLWSPAGCTSLYLIVETSSFPRR